MTFFLKVIIRAKHGHALIKRWLQVIELMVQSSSRAAGWLLRCVPRPAPLPHV